MRFRNRLSLTVLALASACLYPVAALASPMLVYQRGHAMVNDGAPLIELRVQASGEAVLIRYAVADGPVRSSFLVPQQALASLQHAAGDIQPLDYSLQQIRTAKAAAAAKKAYAESGQVVRHVSDITFVDFALDLDGLERAASGHGSIKLQNLREQAEAFPEVTALQRWSMLEREVLDLIDGAVATQSQGVGHD